MSPHRRAKVLLVSVGSRGDVQPFVDLARRLTRHGHAPTVATDVMHRERVVGAGVAWQPLGDLDFARFSRAMRLILESADVGRRTVAAGHALFFSRIAAVTTALQRIYDEAAYDHLVCAEPFLFLPREILARTPVTVLAYSLLSDVQVPLYGARVAPEAFTCLYTVSPSLMGLPPTAPSNWRQTGQIWCEDAADCAPEALLRFLSAGPKPVFATLGSMAGLDADELTAMLLTAARLAGVRLVIQRGYAGLGSGEHDSNVFVLDGEVSYRWLFTCVAAVVLHGGAGTTALAAQAGVPTVFLPQFVDHRIWAERFVTLGTSPGMAGPGAYDARELSELIAAAAGDARYAEAGAKLRDAMALESDGGDAAAADFGTAS